MSVQTQIDQLLARAGFLSHHKELLGTWEFNPRERVLEEAGRTYSYKEVDWVTFDGYCGDLTFTCHGPNPRFTIRALARAFGGRWDKTPNSYSFRITRKINDNLTVDIEANREAVCTKRVISTTTVEVPAREATTREVEEVEWDCGALLAGIEAATPATWSNNAS